MAGVGFSVSVTGLEAVIAAFTSAGVEAAAKAGIALAEATNKVSETAKSTAPRQTGALSGSITPSVSGTVGEVTAGIRYAGFVEYGTYKDAPQPYMGPALDAVAPSFIADMQSIAADV